MSREGVRQGQEGGPDRDPGPGATSPAESAPPLLEVRDLAVRFHTHRATVHAVNGVSWALRTGESLALVGESGSGKSVGALALLGLVPPPGHIASGSVRLRGSDLLELEPAGWRRIRGREVAMVFQDPMTSLNPVLPVGRQIAEVLRRHEAMDRRAAEAEAARLVARVGIPDGARRLRDHPHQFSGGQRQRIMIAMALACRPAVLIADEPTTALDVTVQAQIVRLVRELQEEMGMAVLWITHDLALAAEVVDRVAVMYAGSIVEEAPVEELFRNPRHPYTRGLLGALPRLDGPGAEGADAASGASDGRSGGTDGASGDSDPLRLASIEGRPPRLLSEPTACAFAPRCGYATAKCREAVPSLVAIQGSDGRHRSACWHRESLP